MKNERMRKWNIYDVSVNAKLSTFNIIHYHSILFHITQVVHWRVVLINSAVPRLFAHRCWGISPIQVLVSHPYRCWYLTHTPNGVSLIELSANQGVVFSHSTSSHKTPFRHLRSRLLVSTTASHSSSLLCHTRHLFVLPSVISQLCHSSSPSSDARHLQALRLVISREITTEAPERTFLSLLGGCKWAQEAYASLLPPKSYLLIPTHHSSNDLFSSDSPFRILLLCNTSIAHLSRLQFLTLFKNCA